ncbi:MAG TPA: glutamate--tRNA ligase [Pseudomonadales bacterium]|nr:glutamate--tRNA ligase [Pseudomonadales bacterium]
MTVRTRIAPSPTGDPHVGTAYIALFNLCFARQHGGQFLLRIEDTDRERSSSSSEQRIFDALRWLGLDWDEGPEVGGPHGPYRQSERGLIYQLHVRQLLEQGHAFHCFCSEERLTELRKRQLVLQEQPGYDGHCLQLSQAQVQSRLAAGETAVVRMVVPRTGRCQFDDLLRGSIEIDWQQVDMQILQKSDGMPTYHLANVVDDHLMQITHVIRGEEWINSVPKHLLLYQYFGWQPPVMCHLPLLRNPDKSKLSKRKNPTSIDFYRRMGFLPEVLVNYLGMMGWSMPDGRDKFSLAEMIEAFDLARVSLGGPVFDIDKLKWLNGLYLREEYDTDRFIALYRQWAFDDDYCKRIVPEIRSRIELLSDVVEIAGHFVAGHPRIDASHFSHKSLEIEAIRKILQFGLWQLERLRDWNKEEIHCTIEQLSRAMGHKIRDFLFPFFIAIAGSAASSSVLEAMAILGPDLSRARLRRAIEILGGVSKKESKRWEDELAALVEAMQQAAPPSAE